MVKTKKKPNKVTVAVPLDPETHDLVTKLAAQRDQPVARVVRRLIEAGIVAEGISASRLPLAAPAASSPAPNKGEDSGETTSEDDRF